MIKIEHLKLILLAGFICLLALTESGFRYAWYRENGTYDIDCRKTRIFIKDQYSGYRLRPGYDSRIDFNEDCETDLPVIRGTKEAYQSRAWRLANRNNKNFTVNSLGFRGPEIDINDQSKLIILALGDSITMGNGISDDETWPAYLEKHLKNKGFVNVKVVNGGVGGFSSRNQPGFFKYYGSKARPKVLLVYDGWSELSLVWNMKERWNKTYLGDLATLAGASKFIYDSPSLAIRSMYSFLNKSCSKIKALVLGNQASAYTTSLPLIHKDYWVKAWKENLDELRRLAGENNAEVYLLKYPGLCRNNSSSHEKDLVLKETRVGTLSNYVFWVQAKERIDQVLKSYNDFSILDGESGFQAFKDGGYTEFFFDEMHMSKRGNDKFAEFIADRLANDVNFVRKYREQSEHPG